MPKYFRLVYLSGCLTVTESQQPITCRLWAVATLLFIPFFFLIQRVVVAAGSFKHFMRIIEMFKSLLWISYEIEFMQVKWVYLLKMIFRKICKICMIMLHVYWNSKHYLNKILKFENNCIKIYTKLLKHFSLYF